MSETSKTTQDEVEVPGAKRSKTASIFDSDDEVLSDGLWERRESILQGYQSSQPYPHYQIHDVFRSDFLLRCKEEIKSQTKVNFKESDLFRVYQSIDFANLDPERAASIPLDISKLETVRKLRDVLYSQEWRSFVEVCAGLSPGTLIDKIDCACNCHAPGCHLLCHDDVIGTRKISYIIYLTEENWDGPKEGGALELYGPQLEDKTSLPIPENKAWPVFNSMAFFEVLPGKSFHAVQEVRGDRPRLSLQGWYHSRDPPSEEDMEKATLQQLKALTKPAPVDTKTPPELSKLTDFGPADKEYLQEYIQSEYLTEDSMNEIQTKFEENSTIQFRNFLLPKWVPAVPPHSKERASDHEYLEGTSEEWKIRGPAHKQRYLAFQSPKPKETIGSALKIIQSKVFESKAFSRYLKRITSLDEPISSKETLRRFRPGLDYTVAHYGLLRDTSVLDATMCFVNDTTEEDQAMWESGDMGGFECYIEADIETSDDPKGPADEYNEEDDTALLSVSASNNTLSLVYRDPGTMRFVKYLSSSAPSSRYDICMEYELPPEP